MSDQRGQSTSVEVLGRRVEASFSQEREKESANSGEPGSSCGSSDAKSGSAITCGPSIQPALFCLSRLVRL